MPEEEEMKERCRSEILLYHSVVFAAALIQAAPTSGTRIVVATSIAELSASLDGGLR